MKRYGWVKAMQGTMRNRVAGVVAAGALALLGLRTTATAETAAPQGAGLDAAYAEHLRATKGIAEIRTCHLSSLGPKGLEVVVVSAGFTAAEQDAFRRICDQFAKSLFVLSPWSRFRDAVNVRAVFVADESADATRLRVSGYKGQVLSCDNGAAFEYAGYAAEPNGVVVIHNSAYSTAGTGPWGVVTMNRGDANSPGTPVHELGHGLAGLGDEYIQRSGPFNEPPESLKDTVNVTAEPNPRLCKWHYWTEEEWPGLFKRLTRPAGRVIANFEGAGWPTKIFRPEEACIMRCSCDAFCVVCNETLEANFFRYLNLFETVEPQGQELVLWKGESVDFRVRAIDLVRAAPAWLASRLDLYLDGRRVARADRGEVAFRLSAGSVAPGVHQVGAQLNLESDFVRRDFGFLSRSRAWRVKVMPQARPTLSLDARVVIPPGGRIDVPVKLKHARPSLFELKLAHAPTNAVLEQGRFKWSPAGRTGSWRVDVSAVFQDQVAVTETLELDVVPADGARVTVDAEAPAVVDAVAGQQATVQLKAAATDGGHVLFEPLDVPAGVAIDRDTGVVTWTPDTLQAGLQSLRFHVRSGTATRELSALFRVRRLARPAPVSYCNNYVPQTLEELKRLPGGGAVYQRLFETLRLLRDRYARVHEPALAAAEKMYAELPPELRENGLQELSLRAWAFTDKPAILGWMRRIAAAGSSDEARNLSRKLELIATFNSLRAIETSGGVGDLKPLLPLLVATADDTIRSAVERAFAAICKRAEDKESCRLAVVDALSRAKPAARAALLPLLPLVRTPAAMESLTAAARDSDRTVAAKAVATLEAAGGLAQLAPLASLLSEASRDTERAALERAAAAICRREGDKEACQRVILPALAGARGPGRAALVRALPLARTPAAVEALTAACGDPDKVVARAARQAVEYLNGLGATDGFVADWRLCGPYVATNGGSCFEQAFAPEQADSKAEWKPYAAKPENGLRCVPLDRIFGGDNRAAYMRAVIRADQAREVCFEAGSDDGLTVWLNGRLIHSKNALRPMKPGDDTFKGALKAGDNALLCKVSQHGGGWSACVRIRSADGGDALGVSVVKP